MNCLKKLFISCIDTIRCSEVIGFRARPLYDGEHNRFLYQKKYHHFEIGPKEKVLDVGCGAYPFPYATLLVDLHTEKSKHRNEDLKTDGKSFLIADISHLPFKNKSYDFVFCSHVLEHVDNPKHACEELMRVGGRGYIETPSLMTDALFSWAQGMHKWVTMILANRLIFLEYNERLVEGVRNSYWRKSIFSKKYHPLQEVFFNNMDIFNNSLMWNDYFNYSVFYLDGRMVHSNLTTKNDEPQA